MRRPSWNRVHGIRNILWKRHESALRVAVAHDVACGPGTQHAAMLRGKAKAYREADELLARLEAGGRFRKAKR